VAKKPEGRSLRGLEKKRGGLTMHPTQPTVVEENHLRVWLSTKNHQTEGHGRDPREKSTRDANERMNQRIGEKGSLVF